MGSVVSGRSIHRVGVVVSGTLLVLGVVGGVMFAPSIPLTTLTTTTHPLTVNPPPGDYPVMTAHGVRLGMTESYTIGHAWQDYPDIRWIRDDLTCRIGVVNDSLTVSASGPSVVSVTAQEPGTATLRGVEVGSVAGDVYAIYGPPDESGRLVLPDGDDELVIEVNDDKVSYLWARRIGSQLQC